MSRFWLFQLAQLALAFTPAAALSAFGPPENLWANVGFIGYSVWFCADVLVGDDGRLLVWPFVKPQPRQTA